MEQILINELNDLFLSLFNLVELFILIAVYIIFYETLRILLFREYTKKEDKKNEPNN